MLALMLRSGQDGVGDAVWWWRWRRRIIFSMLKEIGKEFSAGLLELNRKYQDVLPAPIRAQFLMTYALALADCFKSECEAAVVQAGQLSEVSCASVTEDEFCLLARDLHRRVRSRSGSGN
jgi:hypothetical protein